MRYVGAFLACVALATLLGSCSAAKQRLYDSAVGARRSDAGLDVRSLFVDGRQFSYLERRGSAGGPTVVLIHGFAGSKDHWLALAPALPANARLIVPDLAGHGGSEAISDGTYDAPQLARELAAALNQVAPERVDLVGNSLGGLVATLFALDRPERVRSLALLDPAGMASPSPSASDSLLQAGDAALIPTTRAAYDRLVDLSFTKAPDLPGIARDVLVRDVIRRESFLLGLLTNLGEQRDILADRLGELSVPTILVWGENDRILDPSASQRWLEANPSIQLQILPGVGHAPMMEVPLETAHLLKAFWSGLSD